MPGTHKKSGDNPALTIKSYQILEESGRKRFSTL